MLHCRVRLNNIGTNIMAISSGYYGLRKGSTKSHTYSVLNGKQITKGEGSGNDNVNDNVNTGGNTGGGNSDGNDGGDGDE